MSQHETNSTDIQRSEFAALREFVRGYLHQDMQDEHGSVEAAARSFWKDADRQQRRVVASEWNRLVARFKHRPLAEFNLALTRELGSAHTLEADDVAKISSTFKS